MIWTTLGLTDEERGKHFIAEKLDENRKWLFGGTDLYHSHDLRYDPHIFYHRTNIFGCKGDIIGWRKLNIHSLLYHILTEMHLILCYTSISGFHEMYALKQ